MKDDPRKASPAAVRPRERPDDGNAFLPDPSGGPTTRKRGDEEQDDLAEVLGEEYIASATAAEPVEEDVRNAVVDEELGGPFLDTPADQELAHDDDDANNPPGTEPAAFPTAVRVPRGE